MKTTTFATLALAATLTSSNAVTIDLFEYAFNIDGVVTNGSAPGGVNLAGFDTGTGLGTILMTLSGAGLHYGAVYVDHEIDEASNTYFNEFGTMTGAAAAGQSWEIDEPGFVFGDIYTNFSASALDNSNGVSSNNPDDVSMALGWNVSLASGEIATLSFTLSELRPTGSFYLAQIDPDSGGAVYFSSNMRVDGGTPGVPDVGSTLTLLLCACGGLAGWRALFKFFP